MALPFQTKQIQLFPLSLEGLFLICFILEFLQYNYDISQISPSLLFANMVLEVWNSNEDTTLKNQNPGVLYR